MASPTYAAWAPSSAAVSVNSFLDTFGPTIRQPQPRYTVAPVSPGQGLCIRAAQSATSHCIDAETHAALSGVLPRYQRAGAITDSPSAFGQSVLHSRCLRVHGPRLAHG